MSDSERGVPVRVEFLCDATGEEPARLRSLGAESLLAMAMPHISITQTLFETKEVKAQLLDGKGVAVERIHYANQSEFVVLKAIAFDQRGVNTDVGDFIHVFHVWQRLGGGRSGVRGAVQTEPPPRCAGELVGLP